MDPKVFLSLTDAEKTAYLNSLPEDQRTAFVQSVDAFEQAQNGNTTRNSAIVQPLSTTVNPVVNPADPAADMYGIKPSRRIIPKLSFQRSIDQSLDTLSTVGTVASTMIDAGNMANPSQTEIAPSALSGAAAGALSGAKAGPLGMIGGALFGGVSGAIKAGAQREAYEQQEDWKRKKIMTGLRMAPTMYEEGGMSISEAEDPELPIPVQEEEGEVMLFPDGRLVDSMATKKHKQMKGNDVTDFVPNGTMIFSNSKKKIIDLSAISDHVFNITKGHYSEDGNTPGETLLFKDVYGKGKKTPAAIAKKIKKDFPVVEKPVEQIEIETNKENLRRRAELLLPIMQMQEGVYKKFEFEKPMKFEKGGMARKKKKAAIPHYEEGTGECGVGYTKDESGNCVPDIPLLAGYGEEQFTSFMQHVPQDEYDAIYSRVRDYNNITRDGQLQPIITPLPGVKMPTQLTAQDPTARQLPDTTQISPNVNFPIEATPRVSDDLYNNASDQLNQSRADINQGYDESMTSTHDLYKSQKLKNLGIVVSRLAGVGLQNPNEIPVIQGTEFIDRMNPKIQESEIQANLTPIRKQQNRVLEAINESGISGSKIGDAIASTQERTIEAESDIRNKASIFNKGQEGKRYERLKSVIDLNRAAAVGAENKTNDNRNRMVANIASIGSQALKDAGSLDQALAKSREELKKWKQQNIKQINQDEFNVLARKEENRIRREWDDKIRTEMAAMLSKFIKQQ